MKRNFFKVTLFLCIGVILTAYLQCIFVPKWEYPTLELDTYRIPGFYNEPEESLQVITLGSSHIYCGYSPNEVYENYGITSYNLGSPAQPIQGTYFLLKEAFKTQSPKVVVYDVGMLFSDNHDEALYRYILDQIPFGYDKLAYAKEFIVKDKKNSFWTAIFPLLRYHDRWDELDKRDFMEFSRNKHYFMKGYFLDAKIEAGNTTVEQANDDVNYANSNVNAIKVEYVNGAMNEEMYEIEYYHTQISQENMKWLFKIKELCNENDTELLLVKVPDLNNIFLYSSAWTEQRSLYIKELCSQYNISFFDIMYDCDSCIEWTKDTNDSGKHLNILGAIKVSDILGEYLMSNYDLEENHNELWDQDLAKYQKMRKIALLATKTDFGDYLDELNTDLLGKTVFIAAEDDVVFGMNDAIKEKMQAIGLKTSFDNGFRDSFVAIIENGEIVYEALSDDRIVYNGSTTDNCTYSIMSSGYYTGSDSEIKINGINYAIGGLGFNIVVYDNEADMVVDSVRFSMHEPQKANRDNVWDRLMKYQIYLME